MRKLLLFNLIAFSAVCAQAQNKTIDSLKNVLQTSNTDTGKANTWIHLSSEYINANYPDKATNAARQAMALSERTNYAKGKAAAYHNMGMAEERRRNYEEAHSYYDSAMNFYRIENDNNKIADIYSSIASCYAGQENLPQAVKNIYLSLRLFEQTNNKFGLAVNFLMLGGYNTALKNYDEAIKNLLTAMRFFEELQLKQGLAAATSLLGRLYLDQGNYPEALKKMNDASEIYNGEQEKWNLAATFIDLGSIYEKQSDKLPPSTAATTKRNNYAEALTKYLAALAIYEEFEDKKFIASSQVYIGRVYTKLKNFSKAALYLGKGLDYFRQNDSKTDLEMVYLGLAELESAKGNYQQAYHHYKMYAAYHDSVLSQAGAKESMMYRLQYESEKKEAIAQAERAKKDAEQSRIRSLQYVAIISLGVLAIVVFLFAWIQWRHNKQKQKTNIQLQQEKDKVEQTLSELKATQDQLIQREKMASLGELTAGIAHEIQNPLNFVNNFSEVSMEMLQEMKEEIRKGNTADVLLLSDDIEQNLEKINHHGRRADGIVKNMIEHSRSNTGKHEPTDLNSLTDAYMRLAFHGMRARDHSFNAVLETDYDPQLGLVKVVPQDIGRVLLNLFNNAFYSVHQKKAKLNDAYEPSILVHTRRINGKINISIRDNGFGIPQKIVEKIYQPFFTTKPTGEGTGLGLSLSYDIITKEHGGELKVDTKEGEYAEFIIQLPVEDTSSYT